MTAPSAALRYSQGVRTVQPLCCLGDFNNSHGPEPQSSNNTPDPIDEEWKIMRRRYNSLDSGAPSTSGRGTYPSYPTSNPSRPLNQFGYDDSWDLTDDGGYTPFPVNLPTGEGAEGHGMEMGQMSAGLHLSDSKEIWGKMGQVFVLLFGVGEAETEGIYSLRAMSREEGLPQDTIVAFEDLEDAERYCTLLQATMPHVPNVMPIEPKELLEFCSDAGYNCRLEPRGSWFTPPDYNVGMTDWERSLRLREGRWSVLERDPDRRAQGAGPAAATQQQQPQQLPFHYLSGHYHNNAGAYFSTDYELEELKARLERLLPEE
ncbi:hypothetical protein COCOBI_08-5340 [Coccomyxa sp. Obi]|nr:hypothetical protein COCOBI_08-5340 [Coccomyxa sp. Obi]